MKELFDLCVDGFVEIEGDFEFGGGVRVFELIGGETEDIAHWKEEMEQNYKVIGLY